MSKLHFEELTVGRQWISQGRTVTETDVVNFACLTGDFDPLHVDREHCANTPFRRPIAHGLLGISLVAGLGSQSPSAATVAFVGVRNWEFLHPIFIGDTVRVRTEVVEAQAAGRRRGRVVWRRELINQDDKVVQSGFFETLVAVQSTQPAPKIAPDTSQHRAAG